MTSSGDSDPSRRTARLALLAPPLFAVHWLEEAPDFVAWANAHVDRGIDQALFNQVNLGGLVVTIVVALAHYFARSGASLAATAAWLGFLMAGNAVLHVVAALIDGGYVPGVISAAALYIPFFCLFLAAAARERRVPAVVLMMATVLGALPMLLHGYLILFNRSRLF